MTITLRVVEIEELNKTNPAHRRRGGFQSFMVELQGRMTPGSKLELEHKDLVKINRYAGYTQGGYQDRLKKIFGRTLGQYLENLNR